MRSEFSDYREAQQREERNEDIGCSRLAVGADTAFRTEAASVAQDLQKAHLGSPSNSVLARPYSMTIIRLHENDPLDSHVIILHGNVNDNHIHDDTL